MLPVAAPAPQITLMFDEDLDTLQTCIQQNSEKAFQVLLWLWPNFTPLHRFTDQILQPRPNNHDWTTYKTRHFPGEGKNFIGSDLTGFQQPYKVF